MAGVTSISTGVAVRHTDEVVEQVVAPIECPPIFDGLVRMWAENFDPTGTAHWEDNAPQNNNGEKLRAVALSPSNGKVLKWIASKGGLTQAVYSILGEDKALSRGVAVNIAQVGSVLFTDLTDLLEHFDPFEDE
jgi:hypothetical protein